MFTRTHNLNNEKAKIRKAYLTDETEQGNTKTKKQKEFVKRNLSHVIFRCCSFHETKANKQDNKKTRKEEIETTQQGRQKTRKKKDKERERESDKEK